ncbi:MAG TPA: hypothetical protein DGC76_07165 [Candidatus Accumulibacter sp.]|nr:hypothetical protein [Accumulibacter sp.]
MQLHGVTATRRAGNIIAALMAMDLEPLARVAIDDADVDQCAGVGETQAAGQRQGGEEVGESVHDGLLDWLGDRVNVADRQTGSSQ